MTSRDVFNQDVPAVYSVYLNLHTFWTDSAKGG